MTYPRGAVVAASDPFGTGPERPYLVLSDDRHPFEGEEYVAAVVTTTARDRAVELARGDFARGSLPRQSYASPWNPVTLKDHAIGRHVATVATPTVDEVAEELGFYVGLAR